MIPLRLVDSNADLAVAVNVATQQKQTLNTSYDGFGGWGWGMGGVETVETYTEGDASTAAAVYEGVNDLQACPSPTGRGWREAPGEGRKSQQILRPSPCPLPVGEGETSATVICSHLL